MGLPLVRTGTIGTLTARRSPGASTGPESILALPGRDHWTVCGVLYVGALFASGEWLRLVPTSVSILPQAWSDLLPYLQFEIPHAEGYNAF